MIISVARQIRHFVSLKRLHCTNENNKQVLYFFHVIIFIAFSKLIFFGLKSFQEDVIYIANEILIDCWVKQENLNICLHYSPFAGLLSRGTIYLIYWSMDMTVESMMLWSNTDHSSKGVQGLFCRAVLASLIWCTYAN